MCYPRGSSHRRLAVVTNNIESFDMPFEISPNLTMPFISALCGWFSRPFALQTITTLGIPPVMSLGPWYSAAGSGQHLGGVYFFAVRTSMSVCPHRYGALRPSFTLRADDDVGTRFLIGRVRYRPTATSSDFRRPLGHSPRRRSDP